MSENNSLFEKLSCNDRYGQEFKEEVLLGNGSFGHVYKVLHLKKKQYYAIKKIDFNEQRFNKTLEKFKDEYLKEIRFMETLNKDYVVNYIRSWSEYEDMFYIQMELCETDLRHVLQQLRIEFKRNPLQTTSSIKYYISSELFNEILEALNYLHSQNPPIIHRNLKPDNILITDGVKGRFVKLTGFGLAVIHNFKDQSHTQDRGTIAYMVPEVKNGRHYDTRADVYSLGLIARQLFDLSSINPIDDSLLAEKYKSAQNLVTKMTSEEEEIENRPKCQQILDSEKLWYLNIDILSNDSIYKNIIKSRLDHSMIDCFHKYFIRKKHLKIACEPEFRKIVSVLGGANVGVIDRSIFVAIYTAIVGAIKRSNFRAILAAIKRPIFGSIFGPLGGVIDGAILVAIYATIERWNSVAIFGAMGGAMVRGTVREIDGPFVEVIDGAIFVVVGGAICGAINGAIDGARYRSNNITIFEKVGQAFIVAMGGVVVGGIVGAIGGAILAAIVAVIFAAIVGTIDRSNTGAIVVAMSGAIVLTMAGAIVGANVGAKVGVIVGAFDRSKTEAIFGAMVGAIVEAIITAILVASLAAFSGLISGSIIGPIGGVIDGVIVIMIFVTVSNIDRSNSGAIFGAIPGAISAAISGPILVIGPIGGVIYGAIFVAIYGAIGGVIAAAIDRSNSGAIFGAIGGAIVGLIDGPIGGPISGVIDGAIYVAIFRAIFKSNP